MTGADYRVVTDAAFQLGVGGGVNPAAPGAAGSSELDGSGRSGGSAVLALGSNMGDRLGYLRAAVATIAAEHGVLAASGVYETAPVGGPAQDDYLNAVVLVPAADPRDLLELARRCEAQAHRARTVRWGPRTLDVDVIACGAVRSDDPEILLPHPRAHERAFVCVPWLEVDGGAVLAGRGRVAGLVAVMVADGRTADLRRTGDKLLVRDPATGDGR